MTIIPPQNKRTSFNSVQVPVGTQGVAGPLQNPVRPLIPGNIDLSKRKRIQNDDGSFSTIKSMGVHHDGKEVLIPTIAPDGRQMTPEEAFQWYLESGQHLGKFSTIEDANAFARSLSNSIKPNRR